MEGDVIFPAAIQNRPNECDHGGNDQQAEGQHPVECLVAAAAAGVNEIMLNVKYVRGCPECDLTQGPVARQLWNIHFWDHQQTAQDLIAQAEECEVSNTESKCNSGSKAPMFYRGRRFRLGNGRRFCRLNSIGC